MMWAGRPAIMMAIAIAAASPAAGCRCPPAGTDARRTDAGPAPACLNGLDDDGDGRVDFPNDPGCASAADADELDLPPECADGTDNDGDELADLADPECTDAADDREAALAACANGLDDDGDALEDWSADPGCADAEDPSENGVPSCDAPLPDLSSTGLVSGIFSNADASWFAGSCGGAGPEAVGTVGVPGLLTALSVSVSGASVAVVAYVRDACDDTAAELGCAAGPEAATLALGPVPPGPLWLFADTSDGATAGVWSMNVSGVIASGEPCLPEDVVFLCDLAAGETCRAPVPGAATACLGPACSDGFDNDGDVIVDYPYDCGCDALDDGDETDPPAPAQCCDGADNDGDLLTDFPADPECAAAGDDLEAP